MTKEIQSTKSEALTARQSPDHFNPNSEVAERRIESARGGARHLCRFSMRMFWRVPNPCARLELKRPEGRAPFTLDRSTSGFGIRHSFVIRHSSFVILLALCLLCGVTSSQAQYSIEWSKIAGGGGQSSGGNYSVSGTIGQADAGKMTGGGYSVEGGFWSIAVAVQVDDAPFLTITPDGGNVIVSWPAASIGFVLQKNNDLNPANWSAVSQTPGDDGTAQSVILPATAGTRFFRLQKP